MAEQTEIEIENPIPFVDADPRKVAQGYRIRQEVVDRSPSALHQHYQAMLDEELAKRRAAVEELCAAKIEAAEAAAKAKLTAMDEVLSEKRAMISALQVFQEQETKHALLALTERNAIAAKLREREVSGGELVAQSYAKTVDGIIELLKSPAAQKSLGALLGSLGSKIRGAVSMEGPAESPQPEQAAASAPPDSPAVDLASLPLGELVKLFEGIPAEKIVDEAGHPTSPDKLTLADMLRIMKAHYA